MMMRLGRSDFQCPRRVFEERFEEQIEGKLLGFSICFEMLKGVLTF